jgi:DNA-directed RNA polymerase subunit RPC12/RpoP
MTTTSKQTYRYIARMITSALLFVVLPSLPLIVVSICFRDPDVAPALVRLAVFLWIPIGFYGWWRISGRLVVRARYSCPKCGSRDARFEPTEDKEFLALVCPVCGFRERSDAIQFYGG